MRHESKLSFVKFVSKRSNFRRLWPRSTSYGNATKFDSLPSFNPGLSSSILVNYSCELIAGMWWMNVPSFIKQRVKVHGIVTV